MVIAKRLSDGKFIEAVQISVGRCSSTVSLKNGDIGNTVDYEFYELKKIDIYERPEFRTYKES